jgi:integrase
MHDSPLHLPAWEILAEQPIALAGLTCHERDQLVISAITLENGTVEVVSRFGDSNWRLDMYIHGAGVPQAEKFMDWPADCPKDMVSDMKAACFAWKHRGRNTSDPPNWRTIRHCAFVGMTFIRWLAQHRLSRFDEVRPLHLANYVHHCKNELQLEPRGVRNRLEIIDLLWRFRSESQYPFTFEPFDGHTINRVSELRFGFATARTPIIPRPVQEQVYNFCIGVLEGAEQSRVLVDVQVAHALVQLDAIALRDAALYLVSITTGMRSDEVLGIEVGAYREESLAGVTYRWVRAVENKTGKGPVEYLCPAITGKVLRQLEQWGEPYRARLREEIRDLEDQPPSVSRDLRLLKARADVNRVFLSASSRKAWRVSALTSGAARESMQRIAKAAGVDWLLNPHQTRRTYSRMVVESKMGRASLIFLKWQLKHTSMTMTQGYASNPLADRSLVEDFLDEMLAFRGELLDAWTSNTPLSGGAGRSIVELRATPHKNREALLSSASEHVHIRATGHGWCLAETQGCGGAGLYEATQCVDCRDGVIDPSFAETWMEIHAQQCELLDLQDVGPAVRNRAEREVHLALKVLNDLGLQPATP